MNVVLASVALAALFSREVQSFSLSSKVAASRSSCVMVLQSSLEDVKTSFNDEWILADFEAPSSRDQLHHAASAAAPKKEPAEWFSQAMESFVPPSTKAAAASAKPKSGHSEWFMQAIMEDDRPLSSNPTNNQLSDGPSDWFAFASSTAAKKPPKLQVDDDETADWFTYAMRKAPPAAPPKGSSSLPMEGLHEWFSQVILE